MAKLHRYLIESCAVISLTFLVASPSTGQATRPAPAPPDVPWLRDLSKNPELQAELSRLIARLQREVQFPPSRNESPLLPLLPESTTFYAAFPNYGDVAHQALSIFRQELQENSALRDRWQHGDLAAVGPKLEDSLDKLYQLSQYLGNEFVLAGAMEVPHPKLLIVAEVRKPGLRQLLQQTLTELAGKSNAPVRVFDPEELATAEAGPTQQFVVLVRPDFVVAALDLPALRSFNASLDRGDRKFALTPFGLRVRQSYQGGVTGVAAADLHAILGRVPTGPKQNQLTFERTGFADMKYLVWRRNVVAGQATSQAELSFTGPRHGVASWLAVPGPMGSMDFVSPKAILAGSMLLANPARMFDDVTEIAGASHSSPFAALAQFEQALHINLKQDLLAQLTGEITFELDDITPPKPVWKAILGVKDPARLQQTFATLLAAAHLAPDQFKDSEFTCYRVRIPSPKAPFEIDYAFRGGFLIVGSKYTAVTDAIGSHITGESLGKSKKFLASLPPGHSSGASALLYEDPVAMAALQLRQVAPEMAGSLAQLASGSKPQVICLYGDETAIREASTSVGFDAGAVLVGAAMAIPNLLRSRVAANEASAVGIVRTAVTAEVTYASTYPERGYAPDLATLGPNPVGTVRFTPDQAGVIDASMGKPSCTSAAWCTKSGFRFNLSAACSGKLCKEFVVVGTPVGSDTGGKSFCSTSDGVIRSKPGPPLTSPVTVSECRAWPPLK
jgi:hypothetical protein